MAKLAFQANKIESQDNKVSVMTIGTVAGENDDNSSYPSVAAVSDAVLNKSTELLGYMQSQVDAAVSYVLTSVFPIRYVLTTFDNNDYTDYLGFKWEQISDRFLLASTASEPGGLGGEATHTLTPAEMPSHSHDTFLHCNYGGGTQTVAGRFIIEGPQYVGWSSGNRSNINTGYAGPTGDSGSSQAHNNMPPYVTVRMWRRVA